MRPIAVKIEQHRKTPKPPSNAPDLIDRSQQLRLQDELSFLVFLILLVGLIVLPPHRLLALPAENVPHHVSPRRHVALGGGTFVDIDHAGEEEGFAVLAAEVLCVSIISLMSPPKKKLVAEKGQGTMTGRRCEEDSRIGGAKRVRERGHIPAR